MEPQFGHMASKRNGRPTTEKNPSKPQRLHSRSLMGVMPTLTRFRVCHIRLILAGTMRLRVHLIKPFTFLVLGVRRRLFGVDKVSAEVTFQSRTRRFRFEGSHPRSSARYERCEPRHVPMEMGPSGEEAGCVNDSMRVVHNATRVTIC